MEKRKWDVNSISVIQFSCEIKRKARIWEIWKLQLQEKWYLKGSYLIWLNLSSDVIIEMHYLQVFQSFCLCILSCVHIKSVQWSWADGGRSVEGRFWGKPGCYTKAWCVFSLRQSSLQVDMWSMLMHCAKGTVLLVAVVLDELLGVPFWSFHKKMHLLLNSVLWLEVCLDNATSRPFSGSKIQNLLLFLQVFCFSTFYILPSLWWKPCGGNCLTHGNMVKSYILPLFTLDKHYDGFCDTANLF